MRISFLSTTATMTGLLAAVLFSSVVVVVDATVGFGTGGALGDLDDRGGGDGVWFVCKAGGKKSVTLRSSSSCSRL